LHSQPGILGEQVLLVGVQLANSCCRHRLAFGAPVLNGLSVHVLPISWQLNAGRHVPWRQAICHCLSGPSCRRRLQTQRCDGGHYGGARPLQNSVATRCPRNHLQSFKESVLASPRLCRACTASLSCQDTSGPSRAAPRITLTALMAWSYSYQAPIACVHVAQSSWVSGAGRLAFESSTANPENRQVADNSQNHGNKHAHATATCEQQVAVKCTVWCAWPARVAYGRLWRTTSRHCPRDERDRAESPFAPTRW
jgi:hypothetical protein